MRLIIQTRFRVVFESRLPKNSFVHEHCAVRTVVIVNWCALARLPAQHQHLDKLVLHHAVPRIVAGFETEIRQNFICANCGAFDQLVNLDQRRN